jgi:phenylalanyl-tRNA synthetase beta subunit
MFNYNKQYILPHSNVKNSNTIEVEVDAIRTDILHPCDLAEDIAIAHNYNSSISSFIFIIFQLKTSLCLPLL